MSTASTSTASLLWLRGSVRADGCAAASDPRSAGARLPSALPAAALHSPSPPAELPGR